MKLFIVCVVLCFSSLSFAQSAPVAESSRLVNIAIGPSVPSQDPVFNVKTPVIANGGPATRRSGGEVIGWADTDCYSHNCGASGTCKP